MSDQHSVPIETLVRSRKRFLMYGIIAWFVFLPGVIFLAALFNVGKEVFSISFLLYPSLYAVALVMSIVCLAWADHIQPDDPHRAYKILGYPQIYGLLFLAACILPVAISIALSSIAD